MLSKLPGAKLNLDKSDADKAPFVDGLVGIEAVDDLVGQRLWARVPIRAFGFTSKEGKVAYQLHVYVRGRELWSETDADGHVDIKITKFGG